MERFPSLTAVPRVDVADSSKKQVPEITPPVLDAGNKSNDHYKSRLSPFRYKLRQLCLPIIRYETEVLAALQNKLRTPMLDLYFAWTANLASHTFYVLMLPLPIWLGSSSLLRDLIYVLGYGIYITGYLKDYLCLPRPRSPPLHRITMSTYTTQEYGWPSSHSANATAVTFVMLTKIIEYKLWFSTWGYYLTITVLMIYYVSLIFGRLYCGMHGFFDIIFGSLIGFALFLFRYLIGESYDNLILNNGFNISLVIIGIIAFNLLLIHIHAEPVDDCPCFDDSVAFIGVIIGVDISDLFLVRSKYLIEKNLLQDPLVINFEYQQLGMLRTLFRVFLGILLVVIWKSISKPVIFTILPPIYKLIGINLPRRNYQATAFSKTTNRQIRSTSISNIDSGNDIANIQDFIKGVTDHSQKENVGPATEIDYYELLDYQQRNDPLAKPPSPPVGVFKPRYDVEIIGRLIVYAGVPTMAKWGFIMATELLGLDVKI